MKSLSKYCLTSVAISAGLWVINGQFASTPVNRWTPFAEMGVPRAAACSVQLADGRVLVAGYPAAKLGDTVTLSDLPNKDLNAKYQIHAVTHRITKRNGFTTAISFQKMPE